MSTPLNELERGQLQRVVKPFGLLYRRVGRKFRARWSDLRAGGARNHARWLAFLVGRFRRQYRGWHANDDLADYLRVFIHRRPWLLRLAGCVYLHVAHDLPLTVAESFEMGPNDNPPLIDRNRARSIFLAMGPEFAEVLHRSARAGDLGWRARVASWLPWSRWGTRILSQWVISLRTVAWIHGEMLHSWGPRQDLRRRLAQAVTTAALKTSSRFWILGLPIESPILAAMFPFILVVGPGFFSILSSISLLTLWWYWWHRYQVRLIGHLGREIARELGFLFEVLAKEEKASH